MKINVYLNIYVKDDTITFKIKITMQNIWSMQHICHLQTQIIQLVLNGIHEVYSPIGNLDQHFGHGIEKFKTLAEDLEILICS